MINLSLRCWQRVEANLVRGQLSFGPNHKMRIFTPPRKKLFAKPEDVFVRVDRTAQYGLFLRAFTAAEFRAHFVSKVVEALRPLGGQAIATLSEVVARNPHFSKSRTVLQFNAPLALETFASDLLDFALHGPCVDPSYAMYALMLEDKPADWYATTLGGVTVEGPTALPDAYTHYHSDEIIQRVVLAHHYRVPLQSMWAQTMLIALRKDNNLDQYHLFK